MQFLTSKNNPKFKALKKSLHLDSEDLRSWRRLAIAIFEIKTGLATAVCCLAPPLPCTGVESHCFSWITNPRAPLVFCFVYSRVPFHPGAIHLKQMPDFYWEVAFAYLLTLSGRCFQFGPAPPTSQRYCASKPFCTCS